MFRDPDGAVAPQGASISAVYDLSPAEGRLVALLVAGYRLTEAASRAGISLNTAKTQLKSAFARTGFTRQTDLVAEIRANPLLQVLGR